MLTLYRYFLTAINAKAPAARPALLATVRAGFARGGAALKRSDFARIEHRLRQAQKQLELLQSPGFTGGDTQSVQRVVQREDVLAKTKPRVRVRYDARGNRVVEPQGAPKEHTQHRR